MKLRYSLLTGTLAIAALTACVSENHDFEGNGADGKGYMALNVTHVEPPATRAVTPVTDYPVTLYPAGGSKVDSWDAVSLVPAKYTLAVGNYSVESHTPGIIQKKMTTPYYQGTADLKIEKEITTNVNVVCKMKNSPISLHYDADFLSVFTAWTITIDDGGDMALVFSNADGTTPAPVYWHFEEKVEKLVLNFRGTTQEGSTVAARNELTKSQAEEQYDGDLTYFTGGDALNINFTPVESTTGKVTAIAINATVTFTETSSSMTLEVTDSGTLEEPETPTPGPTPGDDTSITLNLPNNMTVNAATEKSLGDTYIKCDNGIKSIKVSIESTSSEMIESLGDLNTNYGVDFVGGAEIVDNSDIVQLFNDLGQPLSVPAQGDVDYTFPIGNFFGLLGFLSGEHTFNLVIEDMNGNKKNGTLILTVE